ncbi:hypothetical protein SAE02_61220 [Skermanella aerolata]|uniref:Uncharacterized protein n=2 Tax=Skermanella aerolata TaxID=393310 RepID=A0A512DZS1_9PROT|nr:hypothetical protein N826_25740 [Skermanella aerolata KACC 11604]GEO41974.1 hypothetical protein SAE02_61220 [Skermanella aerolata]
MGSINWEMTNTRPASSAERSQDRNAALRFDVKEWRHDMNFMTQGAFERKHASLR